MPHGEDLHLGVDGLGRDGTDPRPRTLADSLTRGAGQAPFRFVSRVSATVQVLGRHFVSQKHPQRMGQHAPRNEELRVCSGVRRMPSMGACIETETRSRS